MTKSTEEKRLYLAAYYEANKEIIKARSKARYEAKREEISEQSKEYRKNNLERRRINNRRWRDNNLEKARKSSRDYNARNRDKLRQTERKRRARKLNNGNEDFTEQQILDLYGSNCHLCNQPINLTVSGRPGRKGWESGLHIDHLIPLSKGGANTLENVRPAHGMCNIRKGARLD